MSAECERALHDVIDGLGQQTLLMALRARFGACELLDHWKQGEFHHDLVFRLPTGAAAPFLVASTNCNGGVKELLALAGRPARWALWHARCPTNPAFEGALPSVPARGHMKWLKPAQDNSPRPRREPHVAAGGNDKASNAGIGELDQRGQSFHVSPCCMARVRHHHWFDPCELLRPDARSELRSTARKRQRGGGWIPLDSDEEAEAGDSRR